jgi:simple sugar transport system ATP-binding protein
MSRVAAPEPEVVLRLRGITKHFGALTANDDVGLELRRGEVVALLGENGAGKTTLMNIIFGHYQADAGEVEAFGHPLPPGHPAAAIAAGIGMVHQHFTLADNLSVLENVIVGTEPSWRPWQSRQAARRKLTELAGRLGLEAEPDAPISELSVGQRQRVEILKALYRDARILILDEPTAVLTPQESEALFETLRRLTESGLSALFISHKMSEVLAVSDRVVVLRDGRVVASRETAATDRGELAELMVGRPLREPRRQPQAPGEPVLELREVSLEGTGGRALLDRLSLSVLAGEILGIAGVSGNGQTELAGLIAGTLRASAGQLKLFGQPLAVDGPEAMIEHKVARIPEDRLAEGVIGDMTVWENAILERYRGRDFSRHGLLRRQAALAHAARIVEEFDVRCPSPQARIRLLSGGNIQKLILGRVFALDPRLILANQPTRGLDIGAVAYVQERLLAARQAGAAVILISEDLDELTALSDRVAVIYRGRLSAPLPREEVTIRKLGLMMAGHDPAEAGDAA